MTNKKHISSRLSKELGIKSSEGSEFLNQTIKIIKKNLITKQVKIHNFGTFQVFKSPQRVGRNPKTKKSYIITPRLRVRFKSSNYVKKFIN